jgi:hypothetical protein
MRWFFFENPKDLIEFIDHSIKVLERDMKIYGDGRYMPVIRRNKEVLESVVEFNDFLVSKKSLGYILVIAQDDIRVIAILNKGGYIEPVDVEEWLREQEMEQEDDP